jgi:plastocyanin
LKRLAILALIGITAWAAATAFAGTRTVKVDDDFFSPKRTTINKGSSIKWKWTGDDAHNVIVKRGPRKFSSSTKDSGTFTRKFTRRGTYKIICDIHLPEMTMTVTVK